MKRYLFIFLFHLILTNCSKNEQKNHFSSTITTEEITSLVIPDITIDKALLTYDRSISIWSLKNEVFSGYATTKGSSGAIIQKIGLLNGKKQNEMVDWYANGQVKSIVNYHKGKLHGEKKIWTSDSTHLLIADINYHLGKVHGEVKKWYPTGELFMTLHYNMGKEEGMQHAFRKNGDLYANYEAKNGRIFGLKKASLCFGLEEQKLKR